MKKYNLDEKILRKHYKKANGVDPTNEVMDWYRTIAPHMTIAYELGRDGESLQAVFPWMREGAGHE